LIQAADRRLYVVKTTNNPQHRRTLVNEWLSAAILRHLQIRVPETVLIQLTPEFIANTPELYLTSGPHNELVPPGFHFASRMSVDPERVAVFDFLPNKLLRALVNKADFLGTLVFDKWVSNADTRQAVFYRTRAKISTPPDGERPARLSLVAQMIDNGFAFGGPHWLFQDSPIHGLYFHTAVYDEVRSLDSFQPWLELVRTFPIEVIDTARKEIPRSWLEDDEVPLERLLETLIKRRARTSDLIEELHRYKPWAFPNWI
jgi:hypothetical protein